MNSQLPKQVTLDGVEVSVSAFELSVYGHRVFVMRGHDSWELWAMVGADRPIMRGFTGPDHAARVGVELLRKKEESKMGEFEPCPFCGAEDSELVSGESCEWWVQCRSCDACGPCIYDEFAAIEAWDDRPIQEN